MFDEFIYKCSKCHRLVIPRDGDIDDGENCIAEDTSRYVEDGIFERDWMFYCKNCLKEINMDDDHVEIGEYDITLTDAKKITKLSTEEMLMKFDHLKCEGHYDNIITYFRNKDIDKFNKKPKVDEWI